MRTRTASRTGFRHRERLDSGSIERAGATNVFRPRERLQDPSPSRLEDDPHSPSLASELDCVKTTLFEYKAWR